MARIASPLGGAVLSLSALLGAGQDRDQTPPVFRGGVELIQLDVSVLDGDRRPVRGLTPDDFTVLIDGHPRRVAAFKFVDLPPPLPVPTAPWLREVVPDVMTNARPAGRVVAILIDDGSFGVKGAADLFAVRKTRDVARAAIDELGPEDLAGVFFTDNGHTAQNFTTDRRRLLRAVEAAALMPSPPTSDGDPRGHRRPTCPCGTCSIDAIGRIADRLRSLPQQRKLIVFASAGVRVDASVATPYNPIGQTDLEEDAHCNARKQRAMADAIRRAGLANVTVQAVDVRGLLAADGAADATGPIDTRIGFLQAIAGDTGGRAVVRNNDMEREVPALIEESSAYYLLGVDAPDLPDDGRLHAVEVGVSRPGLEVRTRRGFHMPTPAERRAMSTPARAGTEAVIAAALRAPDIPLSLAVAPFADPANGRRGALAVALGVTQPNGGPGRARRETIHIQTTAFNVQTGARVGSHRHSLDIGWNATSAGVGGYEVLSRLPVPPGRYEIRSAIETADGRTGSVYAYVDVPDFRQSDLSLSGLVVLATPAPRRAPADALRGLVPEPPTARRTFSRADEVAVFLRIYQRRETADTVTVTTRITDDRNDVVADLTMPVVDTSGRDPIAADHRIELPVWDLTPGEYLLTVHVSDGRRTAERDLRFRIQ